MYFSPGGDAWGVETSNALNWSMRTVTPEEDGIVWHHLIPWDWPSPSRTSHQEGPFWNDLRLLWRGQEREEQLHLYKTYQLYHWATNNPPGEWTQGRHRSSLSACWRIYIAHLGIQPIALKSSRRGWKLRDMFCLLPLWQVRVRKDRWTCLSKSLYILRKLRQKTEAQTRTFKSKIKVKVKSIFSGYLFPGNSMGDLKRKRDKQRSLQFLQNKENVVVIVTGNSGSQNQK